MVNVVINVVKKEVCSTGISGNIGSSLSVTAEPQIPRDRPFNTPSCGFLLSSPLPTEAVSAVLLGHTRLTLLAWIGLNDPFFIVRMQFQNAEPSFIRWFNSSAPWNKMEKSP